MEIKSAEILSVGTELLLGEIANTDAAYLSRALATLGINVYRHTVVGDNESRLSEALGEAFSRADLVILTGGLGPTYDDMTKETAASFFGLPLERHEESYRRLTEYFARRGTAMSENNLKQADMPRGATVFRNDHGTAPGCAIAGAVGGAEKIAILLPGPPSELCPMTDDAVVPYLSQFSNHVTASRNIHLFGIGESRAEEILRGLMQESTNPTVAPYAMRGEVRLRVTARAATRDEALALCDGVVEKICATEVGQYVYGIDVGTLEAALVSALRERGLTVGTAESCTGGLIAKRITDVAGSSEVFLGGVVSYANEVKSHLLSVSEETLAAHGAVSEETAIEMAKGARAALGVDIAVSTTGIAGPGGGTAEKPVGLVYVGIATKDGAHAVRLSLSRPSADRDYVRYVASSHALHLALCAAEHKNS